MQMELMVHVCFNPLKALLVFIIFKNSAHTTLHYYKDQLFNAD
jgi:hypothetical protein